MNIRERMFGLHTPEDVDEFLAAYRLATIFKASITDKTFEGWAYAERYLESRPDVAIGLIMIPADRPASAHVEARTGIKHQSPQLILFKQGIPLFDLDNYSINPEKLAPLLEQYLPAQLGETIINPKVASFQPYRNLLDKLIAGELREEKFQWDYLDLLKQEAGWRSDEDFELLDSLFENPYGRKVQPALIVGLEFKAQLEGKSTPLIERARALKNKL